MILKNIIKKLGFQGIIIAVLLAIILIQYSAYPKIKTSKETVSIDTTALIKRIRKKYKEKEYTPKTETLPKRDITLHIKSKIIINIPKNIDSAEVARKYYAVNMSRDTIVNDTNALIVVTDIINQNEIKSRTVYPMIIYPHIRVVAKTITKPYEPHFALKLGLGASVGQDSYGISAKALFLTKRDKTYGVSYDFINKTFEGSFYWIIRLRKK